MIRCRLPMRTAGVRKPRGGRNRAPRERGAQTGIDGGSKQISVLEISLINDLGQLAVAAERVDEFCADNGVSTRIAFAVNVSVDELLTNTINYGYDDDGRHDISMTVRMEDSVMVVEINDDARPFDPTSIPEPDLEAAIINRPIGGLGAHLVRNMIDGFHYRRSNGRNIVTLTKDTKDAEETE